jgi:Zinc-uptake complex component A periplasmic
VQPGSFNEAQQKPQITHNATNSACNQPGRSRVAGVDSFDESKYSVCISEKSLFAVVTHSEPEVCVLRYCFITLLGLSFLGGCNPPSPPGAASIEPTAGAVEISPTRQYPYKIVATCGMVTDIVREVAGDKANVSGLMGEGVDPHLYKPTRNDVRELMSADVVFYSGLSLEGRMGDNFTSLARGGKPVYAITEEIDPDFLREPPEFAGHYDPHVWMDVSAWSECVSLVAKALGKYDVANADFYGTIDNNWSSWMNMRNNRSPPFRRIGVYW